MARMAHPYAEFDDPTYDTIDRHEDEVRNKVNVTAS